MKPGLLPWCLDGRVDEPVEDRVQELDMLKLEWKHATSTESQWHDLRCVHEESLPNLAQQALPTQFGDVEGTTRDYDAFKKVAEVVCPLPSFKRLAAASLCAGSRCNSVQAGQVESTPASETAEAPAASFAPPSTLWVLEPNGDITIRDTWSSAKYQTIRSIKGTVRPTALKHAPHCAVVRAAGNSNSGPTTVYSHPSGRLEALERSLASVPPSSVLETDYVWIGLADGTIRLIASSGYVFRSAHHTRSHCTESDMFAVHELPKQHNGEVVAFEVSPYHPYRNRCEEDPANRKMTFSDAKRKRIASDLLPPDRHCRYLLSASVDSCIVVWDMVQVYTAIRTLVDRQKSLERGVSQVNALPRSAQFASGSKGGRDHVEGMSRNPEPVLFESHMYADPVVTVAYTSFVQVRPLLRLKGSVFGLRHVRWLSTIVTTEGYRGARQSVALTRDASDQEGKAPFQQTRTRAELREYQKRVLHLSEEDMLKAEQQLQSAHPAIEPIASKCVHLLAAGDANGYVMLWDLSEELHRSAVDTRQKACHTAEGGSMSLARQLQQDSVCTAKRDIDVRSLASHRTSNALYSRSTDKRIQFTGGVSISGLELSLPPVIRITLRRAEPINVVGLTKRGEAHGLPLADEFMPLTDSVALFHAYENLEFFVAVDGSVQFLSCHPTQMNRESEEQLYSLLGGHSPNRIETRRGLDDEVVGSLDFRTFSVYFSKRVLDYYPQPVTSMRLDRQRKELWVARNDGVVSCFSTKTLKALFRIPHPHADATVGPPTSEECDAYLADYHNLAGLPSQLRVHPIASAYPKSHIACMLPVHTTVSDRLLVLHGDAVNRTATVAEATPVASAARVNATFAELGRRLRTTYEFRVRRFDERVSARCAADAAVAAYGRRMRSLQGALRIISDSHVLVDALMVWLRWSRQQRTNRTASLVKTAAASADERRLQWVSHQRRTVADDTSAHRGDILRALLTRQQERSADCLRRYFLKLGRWSEACRRERFVVPYLHTVVNKTVSTRYLQRWVDTVRLKQQQQQCLVQSMKVSLVQQRRLLHDVLHDRFIHWLHWASAKSALSVWNAASNLKWDRHHEQLTASQRARRFFVRWRSRTLERCHKEECSRRQRLVEQAAAADQDIACTLRQSMQLRALRCQASEDEKVLANIVGMHLEALLEVFLNECPCFDDEVQHDVGISARSLLHNPKPNDDGAVALWTAIESMRCESQSLRRKQREKLAAEMLAVQREEALYAAEISLTGNTSCAGPNASLVAYLQSSVLNCRQTKSASDLFALASTLQCELQGLEVDAKRAVQRSREATLETEVAARILNVFVAPRLVEIQRAASSALAARSDVWLEVGVGLDAVESSLLCRDENAGWPCAFLSLSEFVEEHSSDLCEFISCAARLCTVSEVRRIDERLCTPRAD